MIFFDKFTFWLAQKCFITWSISSFEADKSAFSSWYLFLPCHSPYSLVSILITFQTSLFTCQKCPSCATSTPFWTFPRSTRSSTTWTTPRSRCRTRKLCSSRSPTPRPTPTAGRPSSKPRPRQRRPGCRWKCRFLNVWFTRSRTSSRQNSS